jgi:eukaryotic-like serine/threonine-protein kinase
VYCLKCSRRYPEGVTVCPQDDFPLIQEVKDSPISIDDEDRTIPGLSLFSDDDVPKEGAGLETSSDAHDTDPQYKFRHRPQGEKRTLPFSDDTQKDIDLLPEIQDKAQAVFVPAVEPAGEERGKLQSLLPPREAPGLGMSFLGIELHSSYRIDRLISQGRMSSVYEATHLRLAKKRFAVKILNPRLSHHPDAYARFRREAEIASALGHPHIVEVVDFNITEDGHPYLVMELLQGEDLTTRMAHEPMLSVGEIALIVEQVGHGLQAAHHRGIIHRDMKPENIFLVASSDGAIQTKILDFGISKLRDVESVVTSQNLIVGTPYYMSPEQTRFTETSVDHTTDIFSMGCIVYQMLTGRLPFWASNLDDVIEYVATTEPRPLHLLRPDLSLRVEQILAKAMAKKKENRYERVIDFARDLCQALVPSAAKTRETDTLPIMIPSGAVHLRADTEGEFEEDEEEAAPSRTPTAPIVLHPKKSDL